MSANGPQPTVDAAAVETLRERIEARHDADSRRSMQASVDASMVLAAGQRQTIARHLAEGSPAAGVPGFPHPPAAAGNE